MLEIDNLGSGEIFSGDYWEDRQRRGRRKKLGKLDCWRYLSILGLSRLNMMTFVFYFGISMPLKRTDYDGFTGCGLDNPGM